MLDESPCTFHVDLGKCDSGSDSHTRCTPNRCTYTLHRCKCTKFVLLSNPKRTASRAGRNWFKSRVRLTSIVFCYPLYHYNALALNMPNNNSDCNIFDMSFIAVYIVLHAQWQSHFVFSRTSPSPAEFIGNIILFGIIMHFTPSYSNRYAHPEKLHRVKKITIYIYITRYRFICTLQCESEIFQPRVIRAHNNNTWKHMPLLFVCLVGFFWTFFSLV